MNIKPNSIIACDLDGTLCEGEAFSDIDCINAKPIWKMIKKINALHRKGNFIIIYTARKEYLRNATEYWLKKHQVEYNVLVCGKMWATVYIDDRNLKISDL